MPDHNASAELLQALSALPQTDARLEKIPPEILVATGHDDHVMLFLVHVRDANATVSVLMSVITLAESNSILKSLAETGGLIRKRFSVDAAQQLKTTLSDVGTDVELVRPVENSAPC